MAVTFLTNEDKAVLDGQITALTEEIAGLGGGKTAVCMLGVGAPTETTEGEQGVLYMDTLTGDIYKCTSAVNASSLTISTGEGLDNVYIQASNGKAVTVAETSSMYGKYTSTDYLDVQVLKGKTVKITCHIMDIVGFAIYDANKAYIAGVSGRDISNNSSTGTAEKLTVEYEYVMPDNASYIRYSAHTPYVITDCRVNYEGDVDSFSWEYASIQIGDNEGDAFSAMRGAALEEKANDPVFTLPAKSIAVVGHEWNMYFHNILDYMTEEYFIRCNFSPSIGSAKMLNDVLRFTPTEEDVGVHELSLKLYRKTGDTDKQRLVKTHTVSVNVISDVSLTDIKVICIGDSLTQNGTYLAEIQHNLSQGGIVSLGTRTQTVNIGDESLTVNHEGRAGWASYDYTRTRADSKTDDHPFWNEETGAFDFSYYMETQGYSCVDVVCIALGTNGVDKREDVCAAIDIMIASIHAYNPDIQVLVSLITLPGTQDGCGVNNGTQNSELLKMQTLALNETYLQRYQNTMTNVDVVELYFALDTKNDYNTVEQPISARNPQVIVRQNGNVHPSVYGYLKFADVWYNNILYHLTN